MSMAMLTPAEKQSLVANRLLVLGNTHLTEDLYAIMMENQSLTESMVDEIKSMPDTKKRIGRLLDLLTRRSQKALHTFIRALVFTDQEHTADKLNKKLTIQFIQERDRSRGLSQPVSEESSQYANSIVQPSITQLFTGSTSGPVTRGKDRQPSESNSGTSQPNAGTSQPTYGRQPSVVSQPSEDVESKAECSMDVEEDQNDESISELLSQFKKLGRDAFKVSSSFDGEDSNEIKKNSVKNGFAFVINNIVSVKGELDLDEINITFTSIQQFFETMNFRCTEPLENITLAVPATFPVQTTTPKRIFCKLEGTSIALLSTRMEDMIETLVLIQGQTNLRTEVEKFKKQIVLCDAFALYFMGFGESNQRVLMSDEMASIFRDIIVLFNEINMPDLHGIPKLFIFHIAQQGLGDVSPGEDLVDASVNDSPWNDMIIFRTLAAVTKANVACGQRSCNDEPKPTCVDKYVLPFYVLENKAITAKGKLNAVDVLQEVRKFMVQAKRDPANGIVSVALSATPPTPEKQPLYFVMSD